MKLNINGYFLRYTDVGLGKYSYELLRHLNKSRMDVHLFIPNDRVYETDRLAALRDVRIHRDGSMRFFGSDFAGARIWEMCLYRRTRQENNSVLFSPYFSCSANQHHNEIVTVGDVIQYAVPSYGTTIQERIFNLYARYYIKDVKRVITFSEYSKKDIVRYLRVKADRIYPIHLGVSDNYVPVTDSHTLHRTKLQFRLPDHFVLYVGGYDYRKNVAELIKAFTLLRGCPGKRDLFLVLAGNIPAGFKKTIQNIKKAVAESGVAQYIVMLGYVPEEELPSLYSMATLFVYPSFYEGFGLPVLEAIACGTPTIACNCTSIPEILNREDLLYFPGDPQSLADRMKIILEDDRYRKELRAWGLTRSKDFSWQETARKTEEVISSMFA